MTKRKPKAPVVEVPPIPAAFALAFRHFPDGQWVLGTYGTSFGIFTSTAELAEYLRRTADSVEREWAKYAKERSP